MSHGKSENEIISNTHNTARYSVETRHVTWVLLIATCLWGIFGYVMMPQRKDPEFQVRVAVALIPWPGASAERVEQLVTRKVEETAAGNSKIKKIDSISRTGLSVVYFELVQEIKETGKEFDDIKLRLDNIRDLPDGAGPINFMKDFGETAAMMLTVASPQISQVALELRADSIQRQIEEIRAKSSGSRFTIVTGFPETVTLEVVRPTAELLKLYLDQTGAARDVHIIEGRGFLGLDGATDLDEMTILTAVQQFIRERTQASDFHPDVWDPVVIRNPQETRSKLAAAAGHKYSYRDLDDFTDRIEKALKTAPEVSRVTRSGVLNERVYLLYSQARLASYGIQTGQLDDILDARNITLPGGQLSVGGKLVTIDPSGEFKNEKELGDVAIATASGTPVYLRNVADVTRGYESPARFLNFYTWRDEQGNWHRDRAITLAVQMRAGEQIAKFGKAVDEVLNRVQKQLPEDLVVSRTSDQPLQVEESVDLFMTSLYEAIALVVVIALLGFWEWRSAVLMALSIPITLFMTFGMMYALGIDLQQVSIATLIIALGLLVDDPVVAGDAIKRGLAAGYRPLIAAWLGPTKLASAIMFATITNIVAYLPFLMLTGTSGEFLYSLPIVLTCSLIASRLVSMTFIPLLGYYLLKPKSEPTIEERRKKGFAALYYRVGHFAIVHRWAVLAGSGAVLALGAFLMTQLKTQYFPKDLAYLSYVDVWLPEDAPLTSTIEASAQAEAVIRQVTEEYQKEHHKGSKEGTALKSLTTFVGGGGPRFWFTVSPELQQLNYAQIIIQVHDKHDTGHLVPILQRELSEKIAGARVDVRQLEMGGVTGLPVAIRISGDDIPTLRTHADQVKAVFNEIPAADGVRDDWGATSFSVKLQTDADRANLAGLTNMDVAAASAVGMMGSKVTVLREGDKQIPVMARLRMTERAQLGDIQNLYVYSVQGSQKVPLRQVSSISYETRTEKLRRRNQFRTITVSTMPSAGTLPSEIMNAARPKIDAIKADLPPGYTLEVGGEEEDQVKGFRHLSIVLLVSVAAIFLALVFQFKNAIKPFIVFAAVPYGMVGALVALYLMGAPFGFMAFLGVVSLVGVIVSHIIVLFDFIEEKHAEGAPLIDALLEAGIMRLRPVLITVAATVIALFPLASHGGPLWEPMCYAQIGGLTAATFITLLLVPVIYAIAVLDLKVVKWTKADTQVV